MTLPSPDHADPALAPPPGCPAHAPGGGGPARLFGPEAESDPMGLYERLRARHGAVAPVLVHGDVPAWLVLGYRENLDVARTPSRFTRDSRHWRAMQEGRVTPDHPLAPIVAWQPMCTLVDGPEHERLRGAVTDSMNRFDRRGIRRHVTRFADLLVDQFCTDGRADLVDQFAEHLPMLVMTQLLGMPESYGPKLVEAARDLLKGTETAVASNEYVMEALRRLVRRKSAEPGPDFASWLIEHRAELTEDEVVQHLRIVLIAAYETTANLIVNLLRMVLTDRRFRADLAGGHMTLPDAMEQVLWDEPPMMTAVGRWATSDTELAGQSIKAGDLLILGLAAGNADRAVRPDPNVPVHGNRSHLAFSGGPHECPGQDIGRAIADTGVEALLARLPDVRLAVSEADLTWVSALMTRHLVELPVAFTPRRPRPPEPIVVPPPPAPPRPSTADTAVRSGTGPGTASGTGPGTVPGDGSLAGARPRRVRTTWRQRLARWLSGG
ncbi:cytochrome P450 [Streptomyces lycii]|uniref:cytochrome P450 n=1 Tax=Streptomyces lycii TaxID=2654337 RepID=UPI001F2CF052|nr:cytochrome P450 [Streptomyces lycii]